MPAPFVFVTTHRVGDGSLDELRTAAARYAQFVEANEPGMLAHCSYLDEDGRELSLVHVHSTAEAADLHMKAAADLIGQGVALTDGNVRIEVYGAPGPVLAQAMAANAANGTQVSVKAENLAGFARHVSA
jgi:hypothetical protein